MKKIIISNESTEQVLRLRDVLKEIVGIVVVDNHPETFRRRSDIECDTENYRTFTDKQLSELSDEEVHEIDDIAVLRRLPIERLSKQQLDFVKEQNRIKVIPDEADKKYFIDCIRKSDPDEFILMSRRKNNELRQKYNLGRLDIYHILMLCEPHDVSYTMLSTNTRYLNDLLIVLKLNREFTIETKHGIVTLPPMEIYAKLDIEDIIENGGSAMVAVSFHL